MIIRRDILNALGIAMDFAKKEIMWDKAVVLMCSYTQIDEDDVPVAQQLLNETLDEDYNDDNTAAITAEVLEDELSLKEEMYIMEGEQNENKGYMSKVIKESKYEATRLEDVCRTCTQLSLTQKKSFMRFFLTILHFLMESYGNVLILKSIWSCSKMLSLMQRRFMTSPISIMKCLRRNLIN